MPQAQLQCGTKPLKPIATCGGANALPGRQWRGAAMQKSLTKPPQTNSGGLPDAQNGLFYSAKRAVRQPETARFASQNGPFRNALAARQLHKRQGTVKQSYKSRLATACAARSRATPGISKLLARKSNNHIGF